MIQINMAVLNINVGGGGGGGAGGCGGRGVIRKLVYKKYEELSFIDWELRPDDGMFHWLGTRYWLGI